MAPQFSKCTPAQLLEYNDTALQIGRTPIYDEYGRVVPIGEPAGRSGRGFLCYVVWKGRCIGIFYSWGTVVAMTVGYTGMAYRGCKSLEEAQAAWLNGPSHTPPCWPPPVRDPITTHPELYAPAMNNTAANNNTQAAIYTGSTPSPSPSPAASRSSSPPSSPASLASTATFVSARSSPSPEHFKIARGAVPRDALDDDSTVAPLPSPTKRHVGSRSPSHIVATSPIPSSSRRPVQTHHPLIETPRTTTNSVASTTTSSIVVSEGRAYAVTVGDVPGVYLDKYTAFLNAGAHPGRVVRPFHTLERAHEFYAKEERAGRIGVPCYEHELRS